MKFAPTPSRQSPISNRQCTSHVAKRKKVNANDILVHVHVATCHPPPSIAPEIKKTPTLSSPFHFSRIRYHFSIRRRILLSHFPFFGAFFLSHTHFRACSLQAFAGSVKVIRPSNASSFSPGRRLTKRTKTAWKGTSGGHAPWQLQLQMDVHRASDTFFRPLIYVRKISM